MHVKPPVRVTRRGLHALVLARMRVHVPDAKARIARAVSEGREPLWADCGLIAEARNCLLYTSPSPRDRS